MNQTSDIIMHSGSWNATREDLALVEVPAVTDSYCPIPYAELVGQVRDTLPRFDLKIDREQYALASEGKQMFGVIRVTNGHNRDDMQLAIGLRTSYNKSIAPELVAGTSVFVCDNLAFNGAVHIKRKQTSQSWKDLGFMVYEMIAKVDRLYASTISVYDQLKEAPLTRQGADHILLEAVRMRALPIAKVMDVNREYTAPTWDEQWGRDNGWRLFNAFTEVYKSRNPWQMMAESQRLHDVFQSTLNIQPKIVGAITGAAIPSEN